VARTLLQKIRLLFSLTFLITGLGGLKGAHGQTLTPVPSPYLIVSFRSSPDENRPSAHYLLNPAGEVKPYTLRPTPIPTPPPDPLGWVRSFLGEDFTPLGEVQWVVAPGSVPFPIVSFALPQAPSLELYILKEGVLRQVTDVPRLFPEAQTPILSASAQFLSWRPVYGGFLYRARLRDAAGFDHNALYLWDAETETSSLAPYFGLTPAWSPDGEILVGGRLEENPPTAPLYRLWWSNLSTNEEKPLAYGCNPFFSFDGAWLAYDGHEATQIEGYTRCLSSGRVFIRRMADDTSLELGAELGGYLNVVGWLPPWAYPEQSGR